MNERFGIRSLGEIRYLRIWVDNSGRGHRESWYCNRVFVKDLHTGSIYRFPVHDWLGQCMGDGASERLSAAETNVNLVNDSMSIHILAETISYIAMYTGIKNMKGNDENLECKAASMTSGGETSPIEPIFHKCLLAN
ncbi:hypothetical protein Y032_0628g836 [Ancylostoma ceylanicum]|uniref:PLAT domain-containing protein n=1 Tax=Ancylostoma ceylanicum TaxID=53326 RepID=A0A016WJY8_9BILA|nr:hypothetical protein Y032_0628g836 [Ancylostoma ceylanicum]